MWGRARHVVLPSHTASRCARAIVGMTTGSVGINAMRSNHTSWHLCQQNWAFLSHSPQGLGSLARPSSWAIPLPGYADLVTAGGCLQRDSNPGPTVLLACADSRVVGPHGIYANRQAQQHLARTGRPGFLQWRGHMHSPGPPAQALARTPSAKAKVAMPHAREPRRF